MLKLIVAALLLIFLVPKIDAQARIHYEKEYAKSIQGELGGALEVRLPDGSRADLITDYVAYEIDFASKWKESIGQALWYAMQSNKRAGVILIRETKSDFKYVQQLFSALEYTQLSSKLTVLVYPDDFPNVRQEVRNQKVTGYWLSKNSKKRHNKECHNFAQTNGYYCEPNDGKAAGCCGG